MPDWDTKKGVAITVASPTGAGGAYLNANFSALRDETPYNSASDPLASDDSSAGFFVGSQWFNTSSQVMWTCVDDSVGMAEWRTLYSRTSGALILCPGDSTGQRSLQIDAGGDARGIDAVDLQSSRSSSTEVASGNLSVIGGGANNTADGYASTVSGGLSNTASTSYSFIGGGVHNSTSGIYWPAIAGGSYNVAAGECFVGGGARNHANGYGAVICGGWDHYTDPISQAAVICGGRSNSSNTLCFIGSGTRNTASGYYSVISSGKENEAVGGYSYLTPYVPVETAFVGNGYRNIAQHSFVGNGDHNHAYNSSFIGGGKQNTASGIFSLVGNGFLNMTSGDYAAITGGHHNTASYLGAAIGGGVHNTAGNTFSVVGGGLYNEAIGISAVICGGKYNVVAGDYAVLCGGTYGTASGNLSFVGMGGGLTGLNVASGDASVVVGGGGNIASGHFGTIAGGYSNSANGFYSFVAGGYSNTAYGFGSSVVGGFYALADKWCQLAHSAGRFNVQGDAQTSQFVARTQTSDNTPTEVFLDASSGQMTIPTDTTWAFIILLAARRTDADNESAAWRIEGCVDNNAGTTALVGSPITTVLGDDSSGAWTILVDADNTNDALRVWVTGQTSKSINWVAFVRTTEVTG